MNLGFLAIQILNFVVLALVIACMVWSVRYLRRQPLTTAQYRVWLAVVILLPVIGTFLMLIYFSSEKRKVSSQL